jgi:hypothetical protein
MTVLSGASLCGLPSEEIVVGCEPGTFLVNGKCDKCGPGSFSANYSRLECDLCPKNSYAPIYGSSSCVLCDEGQESSKGASQCQDKDYQKEANLAAIIGGVIGGLVGIIALAVSIYVCLFKK